MMATRDQSTICTNINTLTQSACMAAERQCVCVLHATACRL